MRIALLLAIWLVPVSAQTNSAQDVASMMSAAAERQKLAVRQAMDQSIERQRQSIKTQVTAAVETPDPNAFFTVPWPKPVGMAPAVSADCPPLPAEQVEALIEENAQREDLKAELLREVMRRESAFRPCAISAAGAQGLMQLTPATAQQFHVTDAFDPKQNVAAGAKFLKTLLTRYGGDVSLALGAYNAGPRRVDDAGGVPPIAETQDYVAAILKAVLLR